MWWHCVAAVCESGGVVQGSAPGAEGRQCLWRRDRARARTYSCRLRRRRTSAALRRREARDTARGRRRTGGSRQQACSCREPDAPVSSFVAHCGAASHPPVTHLASDRQSAPPDACSLRSATTLLCSLAPSSARGSRRSALRDMTPISAPPAFRRRARSLMTWRSVSVTRKARKRPLCASGSHTSASHVVRELQTRP